MTSIDLRLSLPRAAFVFGEDVAVELSLVNRGAAPLAVPDPEANVNWQPAYELRGPGPHDVVRFDLRSLVRGRPVAPLPPTQAALIDLPPGATHTATLSLGDLGLIKHPGDYTLTARLAWGDLDATSPPLAFTIAPLRARAFAHGVQGGPDDPPEVHAAWLHEDAAGTTLFTAGYEETRPDLGSIRRFSVARLADLPDTVDELLVPWAAHARLEDLIGWVLWRAGGELGGLPTMGYGPLRMTLPFVPTLWAAPPLESRAHAVDLFMVGGPARRTLAMLRIHHDGFAGPPRGELLWTFELPRPVAGAAVVGQPGAFEAVRHLAFVCGEHDHVTIQHALVDGDAPPTALRSVELDDWLPHPGAAPAVFAGQAGDARVSALVASPDTAKQLLLVEARFAPDGAADPDLTRVRLMLPAPAVQAQVRYAQTRDGVRREWAVRLADGSTCTRGVGDGDGPAVVRPASDDPPPLSLLALGDNTYLLERAPTGGFTFRRA